MNKYLIMKKFPIGAIVKCTPCVKRNLIIKGTITGYETDFIRIYSGELGREYFVIEEDIIGVCDEKDN